MVGLGEITYARGIADLKRRDGADEQKMGRIHGKVYSPFLKSTDFWFEWYSCRWNNASSIQSSKYIAFGQALNYNYLQMDGGLLHIVGNGEELKPHVVEKLLTQIPKSGLSSFRA